MYKSVCIVDYGLGNLSSLYFMIKKLKYKVIISKNKIDIKNSNFVILPGVGSFPKAMEALNRYKLIDEIYDRFEKNKPIIGICLGMQLLFDSSNEIKQTQGLGIIPGKIQAFEQKKFACWLECHKGTNVNSKLFSFNNLYFYFNHSYYFTGNKNMKYSIPIIYIIFFNCEKKKYCRYSISS